MSVCSTKTKAVELLSNVSSPLIRKLTETAKNMFASDQLTMLTGKRLSASSSSTRGFGFARGSKGGYRGARGKPNKSFRGRAAKFGAKKEEN